MSAIRQVIRILASEPSAFDGDPYGGFLNQWGHFTGGVAAFLLACAAFFVFDGEMPPRYIAAVFVIGAYVWIIEIRVQGWRGKDSLEDTLFFSMGAMLLPGSLREVAAVGWYSEIVVNVGGVAAGLGAATGACLIYAAARIK